MKAIDLFEKMFILDNIISKNSSMAQGAKKRLPAVHIDLVAARFELLKKIRQILEEVDKDFDVNDLPPVVASAFRFLEKQQIP